MRDAGTPSWKCVGNLWDEVAYQWKKAVPTCCGKSLFPWSFHLFAALPVRFYSASNRLFAGLEACAVEEFLHVDVVGLPVEGVILHDFLI